MAEGKKSFLIYADTIKNIDHLTNEEKGVLFQHLLEYVNDMNPILEDRLILTAWKPLETHLKRDLKKWTDKAPERSEKARKAGLASAESRKLKATKSNSLVENELKPTKSTVNVNVSVNDINNIYNRFVDEVKSGGFDSRIESMYIRLKIKQGSLTPLLIDFKHHLIEEDREHKTTNDLFLNFKNWLNVQDRIKKLDKYRN
jgi:hypothetical protein